MVVVAALVALRLRGLPRRLFWGSGVVEGGGLGSVPAGPLCLQGLCDSRRGRREPATRREDPPNGGTGSGQPLGTDRGCQVLRPGTPASLAGGCPLPCMRQRYRGPRRL